jgi:hypothetical protein
MEQGIWAIRLADRFDDGGNCLVAVVILRILEARWDSIIMHG